MKKALGLLWILVPLAFLAGVLGGRWTVRKPNGGEIAGNAGVQFWTCSMDPQIQLPAPGQCPLCGMDLIPVAKEAGAALGPRQLRLSPAAIELAKIEVAPVERRMPVAEVRMVGKVEYDETRLAHITAWVPGRLDRLYVDYTGISVQKGDHMVSLYSPDLLTAQQELIQAVRTSQELERSELPLIRQRAQETVAAGREKLRLWGLTEEQIREIEGSAQPNDHLTIYTPMSGVVVEKSAVEGMYVNTGSRIYAIADLSQVWVKLDAYESDLAWIHYGQEVEFETAAYPGERFAGRIAFIDPVLNARTRTVKVRVNVSNPDGRLKPDMFVRAVVQARVAAQGKVMDPDLAGKWISPMHPEIVKDAPGTCDVCGMPLVSAESLGYVPARLSETNQPLVIPASAPLWTGRRALVYVALTNRPGLFEGREVILGPRAGNDYLVRGGLEEGELVVAQGNFKIDSAVQLQAKPSMMAPGHGGLLPGHDHAAGEPDRAGAGTEDAPERGAGRIDVPASFRGQLTDAFAAYLELQRELAADQAAEALRAAKRVREALDKVDPARLEEGARSLWEERGGPLSKAGQTLAQATDLEKLRTALAPLSEAVLASIRAVGLDPGQAVYLVHCPMAFGGKGANWLQESNAVLNPYYGKSMLRCGKVVEVLTQAGPAGGEPGHE